MGQSWVQASRNCEVSASVSQPRAPSARDVRDPLLLEELRALYADADRLYAGWSCESSTDCCHFGRTGREPYVTTIELALIRDALRRAGRGRPKRSLPMADRPCELLTSEGRCSIYSARPLGCRTFYCDRATEGESVKHRRVNEMVTRLRELASRYEPRGDLGRPLTRCLAELP